MTFLQNCHDILQEEGFNIQYIWVLTIGGRGVGNWEVDQPNFGRGEWFLDPQGDGTSSAFLGGGERGGE